MSIKLHRFHLSGHSHRVETFLSLIKADYQLVDVNLKKGEHKSPEFLKISPFGQVPAIQDGDYALADSNAILVYLATKYDCSGTWLPTAPADAAEVQCFLSLAAGPIAYGPAKARLVNVFGAKLDHEALISQSHNTLKVVEAHLAGRDWLVTDKPTIADVANYSYIAHAPEGDVSLETYPNIQAWLKRFEELDGFVPMTATAVGLAK